MPGAGHGEKLLGLGRTGAVQDSGKAGLYRGVFQAVYEQGRRAASREGLGHVASGKVITPATSHEVQAHQVERRVNRGLGSLEGRGQRMPGAVEAAVGYHGAHGLRQVGLARGQADGRGPHAVAEEHDVSTQPRTAVAQPGGPGNHVAPVEPSEPDERPAALAMAAHVRYQQAVARLIPVAGVLEHGVPGAAVAVAEYDPASVGVVDGGEHLRHKRDAVLRSDRGPLPGRDLLQPPIGGAALVHGVGKESLAVLGGLAFGRYRGGVGRGRPREAEPHRPVDGPLPLLLVR